MSGIPSITSLHDEKNKKILNTNDIYKTVLYKCIEKIKYTNRHTDKTFIIFEVPKILIGYTNYNMKSCIHFIVNNIISHGYIVQFIEPFYIYIDWGSNRNLNKTFQLNTAELLKKFPNVDQIEYVYEDEYKKNKKDKK